MLDRSERRSRWRRRLDRALSQRSGCRSNSARLRVCENKGGAGGTIASAKSRAIRHPTATRLLLCSNGEMTLAPFFAEADRVRPTERPGSQSRSSVRPQVIVVNPRVPAANMARVISYARSKRRRGHRLRHAGLRIERAHRIRAGQDGGDRCLSFTSPTRAAAGRRGLVAGQIEMAVVTLPAIAPMISAKSVRALAVLQPTRSPLLTNIRR